jgi:oxygen-independent coproporphyrinogen-3 oxidase
MNTKTSNKSANKLIDASLKNIRGDAFLYVHYPFCANRCRYCIYYLDNFSGEKSDDYLKLYNKEILLYAKILSDYKFKNIHIGGGTPNLVSPEALIKPLSKLVNFERLEHFTIEAFPADDFKEYLEKLKKYNVKKINLGIQTIDKKILESERRIVPIRTLLRCLKILSKSNLLWSTDLIYGFNEEDNSSRDYSTELKTILDYNPTGFHLYFIRPKETNYNHYKYRNRYKNQRLNSQKIIRIFDVVNILNKNGYKEISDEWCLGANQDYAKKTVCYDAKTGVSPDVLGIGLGAVSHRRFLQYKNVKNLQKYKFLLNHDKFPIAYFNDLQKTNLYPIINIFSGIKTSQMFDYKKFLSSVSLSKQEKREINSLFDYLKRNKIEYGDKDGKIIISQSQYSQCLYKINEYIQKRESEIINNNH